MKKAFFKALEKLFGFFSRLGVTKNTPGAYFIYNFFHKSFWPYKEIIEIQGSKMYINSNEEYYTMRQTLSEYAKNLVHEKTTTELFKKTVKDGDVVLDLGANIGYFTLLAAKLAGPKGKVFSFEPEPKNFSYLKKNIEINNYFYASPNQKAVSDQNGKTKLFFCSYDSGHHTINQKSGIDAYSHGRKVEEQAIEIETVALDSFLSGKTDHVDVIKMDVEGAEALALSGMDKILKNNQNIKMFVEFFPMLIEKMGSSPEEFIEKLLNEYKFRLFMIPDDYAASSGEMKELKNVKEVMSYRKQEEDHINLFLKR